MDRLSTILIVDDDGDVRQAAQLALAPHSGRVETASSLEEMMALIMSEQFDCVLLDMNFVLGERSGRAGMNALEAIKASDPTLAVILMTSYGAVSLAVESLKRGAFDFILKPWRNEALVAAVRKASEHTRAERRGISLDVIEKIAIEKALTRHDGNIARAASMLGLSRPALYRRMTKYGL